MAWKFDGIIDQDWLEDADNEDSICDLCCAVLWMRGLTMACAEGHSFCHECVVKTRARSNRCPQCRGDMRTTRRNRGQENLIGKLRTFCKNGRAAKELRVWRTICAEMATEALKMELGQGGLDTTGDQVALASRLQAHRDAASCTWNGAVMDLAAHLESFCPWQHMLCQNEG